VLAGTVLLRLGDRIPDPLHEASGGIGRPPSRIARPARAE
jgi:hypothetical protein